MTHIREWATGAPRGRWSPFLAGAAVGLLAGVLVRKAGGPGGRGRQTRGGVDHRWARLRETWDAAVDGATEGLAAARTRVSGDPTALDTAALEGRVSGMACAGECRIRRLGDGIVEVVGDCASEEDARALLDAVAGEPGVEVVVNRVWTPASAAPGDGTG